MTLVELMRATSVDPMLVVLEQALGNTLLDAWERRAGDVVGQVAEVMSAAGLRDFAQLDAILEAASVELGAGLKDEIRDAMRIALDGSYSIGRRAIFDRLPSDVVFNVTDQNARAWLTDNHTFWVGEHYDRNISGQIAKTVRERVTEQGMSSRAAGQELQAVMRERFAIKGSETYWRGVAMNASTQATNFGRVESFAQAGVQKIRIVNPNDEITSEVCKYMHGAVYDLAPAVGQRDAMIGAATPDAARSAHRWTTGPEVKRIGGGFGGSSADTAALARAGIVMPPLHMFCRSLVVTHSFGELRPIA